MRRRTFCRVAADELYAQDRFLASLGPEWRQRIVSPDSLLELQESCSTDTQSTVNAYSNMADEFNKAISQGSFHAYASSMGVIPKQAVADWLLLKPWSADDVQSAARNLFIQPGPPPKDARYPQSDFLLHVYLALGGDVGHGILRWMSFSSLERAILLCDPTLRAAVHQFCSGDDLCVTRGDTTTRFPLSHEQRDFAYEDAHLASMVEDARDSLTEFVIYILQGNDVLRKASVGQLVESWITSYTPDHRSEFIQKSSSDVIRKAVHAVDAYLEALDTLDIKGIDPTHFALGVQNDVPLSGLALSTLLLTSEDLPSALSSCLPTQALFMKSSWDDHTVLVPGGCDEMSLGPVVSGGQDSESLARLVLGEGPEADRSVAQLDEELYRAVPELEELSTVAAYRIAEGARKRRSGMRPFALASRDNPVQQHFAFSRFRQTLRGAPASVAASVWDALSDNIRDSYAVPSPAALPLPLAMLQAYGVVVPFWELPTGFEPFLAESLWRERSLEGVHLSAAVSQAIEAWAAMTPAERLEYGREAPDGVAMLAWKEEVPRVAASRPRFDAWFFTSHDRFGLAEGRARFEGSDAEWTVLTDGEKMRYMSHADFGDIDVMLRGLVRGMQSRLFAKRFLARQCSHNKSLISFRSLHRAFATWESQEAPCYIPTITVFEAQTLLAQQPGALREFSSFIGSTPTSSAMSGILPLHCVDTEVFYSWAAHLLDGDVTPEQVKTRIADARVLSGCAQPPSPATLSNVLEALSMIVPDTYTDFIPQLVNPVYEPSELHHISGLTPARAAGTLLRPSPDKMKEAFAALPSSTQERYIQQVDSEKVGDDITEDDASKMCMESPRMQSPAGFREWVDVLSRSGPTALCDVAAAAETVSRGRGDGAHALRESDEIELAVKCAKIITARYADFTAFSDSEWTLGCKADLLRAVNRHGDAAHGLLSAPLLPDASDNIGYAFFEGNMLRAPPANPRVASLVAAMWENLPHPIRDVYYRNAATCLFSSLDTTAFRKRTADLGPLGGAHARQTLDALLSGTCALEVSEYERPACITAFDVVCERQGLVVVPPGSLPDTSMCAKAGAIALTGMSEEEVWACVEEAERRSGEVEACPAPALANPRRVAGILGRQAVYRGTPIPPIAFFVDDVLPHVPEGTERTTFIQLFLSRHGYEQLPYILKARRYARMRGLADTSVQSLALRIFTVTTACNNSHWALLADHRKEHYTRNAEMVLDETLDIRQLQQPTTLFGAFLASPVCAFMALEEAEERFHTTARLNPALLAVHDAKCLNGKRWAAANLTGALDSSASVTPMLVAVAEKHCAATYQAAQLFVNDLSLEDGDEEWALADGEMAEGYRKRSLEIITSSVHALRHDDYPIAFGMPAGTLPFLRLNDNEKRHALTEAVHGLLQRMASSHHLHEQFPRGDVIESFGHEYCLTRHEAAETMQSLPEEFWNVLQRQQRFIKDLGMVDEGIDEVADLRQKVRETLQLEFCPDTTKLNVLLHYVEDAVTLDEETYYFAALHATQVLQALKLSNFGFKHGTEVGEAMESRLATDLIHDGRDISREVRDEDMVTLELKSLHVARSLYPGHPALEYWRPLTSALSLPLWSHRDQDAKLEPKAMYSAIEGAQARPTWRNLPAQDKLPYIAMSTASRSDASTISTMSLVHRSIATIRTLLHLDENKVGIARSAPAQSPEEKKKKSSSSSKKSISAGDIRTTMRSLSPKDMMRVLCELDFSSGAMPTSNVSRKAASEA